MLTNKDCTKLEKGRSVNTKAHTHTHTSRSYVDI